MSIYEAFVYEWTNTSNGMKYIGSHKGTVDDGYISSSKYLLEDYKKHPSWFSRNIIAFGSVHEMRRLETELLQKVDASNNPMYYNKHNQDGKFLCLSHTDETKEKMKGRIPWNKGKRNVYDDKSLEKMKQAKQDYIPWNKGISTSDETRQKLSKYKAEKHHLYGKKRPEHSDKMTGRKHSEETKLKMKLAWEKRKLTNV